MDIDLQKYFLWPVYKSTPQLLGRKFVQNFSTYTRVYTVTAKYEVKKYKVIYFDANTFYVAIKMSTLGQNWVNGHRLWYGYG